MLKTLRNKMPVHGDSREHLPVNNNQDKMRYAIRNMVCLANY